MIVRVARGRPIHGSCSATVRTPLRVASTKLDTQMGAKKECCYGLEERSDTGQIHLSPFAMTISSGAETVFEANNAS